MNKDCDRDEIIAQQLQAEFDAEAAGHSIRPMAAIHTMSDSDSDSRPTASRLSDSDKTPSEDELENLSTFQSGHKRSSTEAREPSPNSSTGPDASAKRPRVTDENKPWCQYGSRCYRKNAEHIGKFRHANHPPAGPTTNDSFTVLPNELRLTHVTGLPPHYNRGIAVTLKDILGESLGTLNSSVQFNYVFEVDWLVLQYPVEHRKKPLLLVHGDRQQAKRVLEKQASSHSHIRLCQAPLQDAFGTHHTKMMMLHYEQGLRVVIHTANLIERDWHQKTQAVWMSPLFKPMSSDDVGNNSTNPGGDSETNFKRDLLTYLAAYSCSALGAWSDLVKRHDFSSAKVWLVGSTPGRHTGSRKNLFGHLRLRSILSGPSGPTVDHSWPVIGQFSSIGSLGANPSGWLCGEWLQSLASVRSSKQQQHSKSTPLKLVFPSVDDVRMSLEGYPAGASLPYSKENDSKQPWLHGFLHRWRSERHGRTVACPHVKTYLRTSPDQSKIAWMLITSANLSKAAWGNTEKADTQLHIRSYELGVLLVAGTTLGQKNSHEQNSSFDAENVLVPFDLPLKMYSSSDRPWTWNAAHTTRPDRNGNVWQPS